MGIGIVISGELEGNAAATQFPSRDCEIICVQANKDNGAHLVYIGGEGVTIPDGTADETSGIYLAAGEKTPWLAVRNTDALWYICSNILADLHYVAIK